MLQRRSLLLGAGASLVALPVMAQFTGPSVQGQASTVADVENLRVGRYVTLEGNIIAHERADYYTFQDGTGTLRVEISSERFGGQAIGPDDRVRIMGEIDTGRSGQYLWVKTLQTI